MCKGLAFSFCHPWQRGSHIGNKSTVKCSSNYLKKIKSWGQYLIQSDYRICSTNIFKTPVSIHSRSPKGQWKGTPVFQRLRITFHTCESNKQKSSLSHNLALGPNSTLFYFSLTFLPPQEFFVQVLGPKGLTTIIKKSI